MKPMDRFERLWRDHRGRCRAVDDLDITFGCDVVRHIKEAEAAAAERERAFVLAYVHQVVIDYALLDVESDHDLFGLLAEAIDAVRDDLRAGRHVAQPEEGASCDSSSSRAPSPAPSSGTSGTPAGASGTR